MESLKRLLFNLAAGFTSLVRNRVEPAAKGDGGMVSDRVSREVNNYRMHFFNV